MAKGHRVYKIIRWKGSRCFLLVDSEYGLRDAIASTETLDEMKCECLCRGLAFSWEKSVKIDSMYIDSFWEEEETGGRR